MDKQANDELRIFKEFVRVSPYHIDFNSIETRNPREPDIFCKLLDGNPLVFEVVECIDMDIARSIYDSMEVKQAFYTELEKLPNEKKHKIKTNFSDASIYVAFCKGISKNKKLQSIKTIFDYLLTIKHKVEGEFNLKSHTYLRNVVRWILIQRGVSGPMFDIEAATSFSDPTQERIKDKFFKKIYTTNADIELLCYYELQPELPESTWLPSIKEFVKTNLENSPFRRVWIYSVTKNKIIYVFPQTPPSPAS